MRPYRYRHPRHNAEGLLASLALAALLMLLAWLFR